MRQRSLAMLTSSLTEIVSGRVENQYLVGSFSPSGHSISSHSSGQGCAHQSSRCAGRTRTVAKRDVSDVLLPSRQVTLCQACAGSPLARSLGETGLWSASRRISLGGRPRPLQGLGGSGVVPGGHRLTDDCTPAT